MTTGELWGESYPRTTKKRRGGSCETHRISKTSWGFVARKCRINGRNINSSSHCSRCIIVAVVGAVVIVLVVAVVAVAVAAGAGVGLGLGLAGPLPIAQH